MMQRQGLEAEPLIRVYFRLMVALISRSHCYAMSVLLQQNGSCTHSPVCLLYAAGTGKYVCLCFSLPYF